MNMETEMQPAPMHRSERDYAARKKAVRDRFRSLAGGVLQDLLANPADLEKYFRMQAAFPEHGVNNILLILGQRPQASELKTYDDWKKMGCPVRRGEKGIGLFRRDGPEARSERKSSPVREIEYYFDRSQVMSPPRKAPPLQRTVSERILLEALLESAVPEILPVGIDSEILEAGMAEYVHEEKSVHIAEGIAEEDLFHALTAELAHGEFAAGQEYYDRSAHLWMAEGCAFLMDRHWGFLYPCYQQWSLPDSLSGNSPQDLQHKLTASRAAFLVLRDRLAASYRRRLRKEGGEEHGN